MTDCKNLQHGPRIINQARSEFPRMARNLCYMLSAHVETHDQTP